MALIPRDEKQVTVDVAPVYATMVGTGDGSLPVPQGGLEVETPAGKPNVIVNVIGPMRAIAIRFVYAYLTSVFGLLTAAMTPAGGKVLYTGEFVDLVVTCASLGLSGPALAFGKDLITIFGKLEQKYPLLTGSV